MSRDTYVSSDALERADAYHYGYLNVCHHPKEIGVLESDQSLVIDFDTVLFDDKDLAVLKANEAANRGVVVGIHTYYPNDPRLERILGLPNVIVAKNDETELPKHGWYNDNSQGSTHSACELQANANGLFDILGNVWEWCEDWYDSEASATLAPAGRLARGASARLIF